MVLFAVIAGVYYVRLVVLAYFQEGQSNSA